MEYKKLKNFLSAPDLNLSGVVKMAGVSVSVSAVQSWLSNNKALAKEHIDKIEAYLIACRGFVPEQDLYLDVDNLFQSITKNIQIFEAVRDYERDLTESEKEIYKILYLIQDLLASTNFLKNDNRSFIDFEDGGIYRFNISAENRNLIEHIFNNITK